MKISQNVTLKAEKGWQQNQRFIEQGKRDL
jgi:hypothetical protein